MKIRIVAPLNPVFDPLFANHGKLEGYEIELHRVTEKVAASMFAEGKADAAFISPLHYGEGVKKEDYRIVPSTCLAAGGYTMLASVHFRPGLDTVNTIASPDTDDFIIRIGNYLLGEMYGMDLKLKQGPDSVEKLLKENDAAVMWNKTGTAAGATDVSEDWTEHTSQPLILGAWVVRNDKEPANIVEITTRMAAIPDSGRIDISAEEDESEMVRREGSIIYVWNDEMEAAMDEILEFLYYRQAIPDFASVKMFGTEYGAPAEQTLNRMADTLLGEDKADRSYEEEDSEDHDTDYAGYDEDEDY